MTNPIKINLFLNDTCPFDNQNDLLKFNTNTNSKKNTSENKFGFGTTSKQSGGKNNKYFLIKKI